MKKLKALVWLAIFCGSASFLTMPALSAREDDGDREERGERGEHRGEGKRGWDKHEMNVEKRLEKMTKRLKLTPEQQTEIKKMLEEKKQKMEEMMQQMKAAQEGFREKMKSLLNEEQKKKFGEEKAAQDCPKECCRKKRHKE